MVASMSDFAAFRGGTEGTRSGHGKTAFVFAGGGSFGSIQVGMLRALAAHGITADMVVGSSVGAMNAAYYASNPTPEGIEKLAAIWRSLRRNERISDHVAHACWVYPATGFCLF